MHVGKIKDGRSSFRPNRDYLTGGQWSPTRPAVFVTSNTEGTREIRALPSIVVRRFDSDLGFTLQTR